MARFPDRWQASQQASSSYASEEAEWPTAKIYSLIYCHRHLAENYKYADDLHTNTISSL